MRKTEKWHFLPLIISVLTLSACFVPYQGGDKGTFTIIIGTPKNSRSALPWGDEPIEIEDLTHTIEVSGGPENEQLPLVTVTPDKIKVSGEPENGQLVTVTDSQSVSFTVEPGTWTITIKAYFPEVGDANLKAIASDSVEIKPGRNGAKTITMRSPDGKPPEPSGTFTNIAAFKAWLEEQPANTANTPYTVALNISDLGGTSDTNGSLGALLQANNNKYVYLDLSGSTFTSFPYDSTAYCGAFASCTSLTSITIPDSVTSIREWAFIFCANLASVTIGSGVTSIGMQAFSDCTSLTSLTIPDSVKSIGEQAFFACTSLTGVTIPNGVIGEQAFGFCTGLTSVTIGSGVTSIEAGPFVGCDSLTTINVDSGNTAYSSENGVLYKLYNKNKTALIQYPNGKTGAFTIPDGVTSIEYLAFWGCDSLTGVTTIPNSVTSIGKQAFDGCAGLTGVTILNGVIGEHAFDGCVGLASVTIGSGVTSIEYLAFQGCTSLASVTFQGTITSSNFASSAFGMSGYYDYIGDLREKYLAATGGIGTYTRPDTTSTTWTKIQ